MKLAPFAALNLLPSRLRILLKTFDLFTQDGRRGEAFSGKVRGRFRGTAFRILRQTVSKIPLEPSLACADFDGAGMKGFLQDIGKLAIENVNFRQVLYTL